jgi:hypothetical protein
VATAVLVDLQVITRPVRIVPAKSRVVAVSAAVPPTVTVAVAGVTVTVATGVTGATTVTTDVSAVPSLVAMMDAVPADTPVATPAVLTVATGALVDVHAIARPVSIAPVESRVVAVNVVVPPTAAVAVAGVTVTDATGGGSAAVTVAVALPLWPSHVAVMVALPGSTPVMRPVLSTVATEGSLLTHVTVRFVMVSPALSVRVAIN